MKLLRIDSSARENSISRQLTEAFVTAWKKQCPDGEFFERDVAASVPRPIGEGWVVAATDSEGARRPVNGWGWENRTH